MTDQTPSPSPRAGRGNSPGGDPAARGGVMSWALAVTAVAVVGGLVAWRLMSPDAAAVAADSPPTARTDRADAAPRAGYAATAMAAVGKTRLRPGDDPGDVAAYFHPGDAEPTGAELIDALHEVGVRTGIGAFNPPGTSPPLEGLAVPDDFELPEGYVRHHQATDGGEPIDPILMFAPDFTPVDAQGQPVAMPENRVVTAALAPPGLPLRQVRIPGQ